MIEQKKNKKMYVIIVEIFTSFLADFRKSTYGWISKILYKGETKNKLDTTIWTSL